jgi:hypothetical protein
LLTPAFRVMDSWLPLPPLSLIAILRKRGPEQSQPVPPIETCP